MSKGVPPKYVRQTLVKLQSRGHLAYLVGGCVRDILLERQPNDWDICTSALPQQVMEIFPTSRATGLKHGTVTVFIHSRSLEITTFRREGEYADHRHPDSVSFVGDLNTDLSRRDFTMNAIAWSADGMLADPFGGIADIRNKLVRCVGVPELRFEEDALRMLRAFRFSSRLGFTIEKTTMAAIRSKAFLCESLAAERVRDEIEKILLTERPWEVQTVISIGLLDSYLIRRTENTEVFQALAGVPRKALERWAVLCVILLREGCITSAETFLSSLRLDGRSIRACAHTQFMLMRPAPETSLEWKKLLNRYGVPSVSCAACCVDAIYGGNYRRKLRNVLKSGECFSMKHLAVGGDDLLELGYRGRELGEMLDFLLEYVMEYPNNNQREILLSLARRTED